MSRWLEGPYERRPWARTLELVLLGGIVAGEFLLVALVALSLWRCSR